MNRGLPLGEWGRWILSPISWPTYCLLLLPILQQVSPECARPESYGLFAMPCLLCAYGIWALFVIGFRSALRISTAIKLGQPRPASVFKDPRFYRAAAIGGLVIAAALLKVPLVCSFYFNRHGLQTIADKYRADPKVPEWNDGSILNLPTVERVGIYRVKGVARLKGAIMLYTSEGAGFAYAPDGTIRGKYNSENEGYLGGGWWWFVED